MTAADPTLDDSPTIVALTAAERATALAALTLGFANDPFNRWMWPEASVFLDAFPRFTMALCGAGFALGAACGTADGRAAALWLPPGASADQEALFAVVAGTIALDRLPALGEVGAQIRRYKPEAPHWYLGVFGCDPPSQGRGLGSALLKHSLRRCDEDGVGAYLEASSPRNVALYLRHGFERLGEIQVADSPILTPMWRAPRGWGKQAA